MCVCCYICILTPQQSNGTNGDAVQVPDHPHERRDVVQEVPASHGPQRLCAADPGETPGAPRGAWRHLGVTINIAWWRGSGNEDRSWVEDSYKGFS